MRLLPATATSASMLGNLRKYAEPKQISWAKPAYGGSSSSNFTVQDHIASTTGDALMKMITYGATAHTD
jgi:hypothetical protein